MLYSTPNVTVRSFDVGAYGKHTKQNAAFLSQMQPERFTFIDGDSSKTLPELAKRVKAGAELPCDVVFIDGSHKLSQVEHDLRNFRASARDRARRTAAHIFFLRHVYASLTRPSPIMMHASACTCAISADLVRRARLHG